MYTYYSKLRGQKLFVTKTDIIKSNKKTGCNNCIFCFSKCLKCGALDITVEYCNYWHYKYRNKFIDHIYVTKLEKKSLGNPQFLKIDCNKCKNKITAIGENDRSGNSQYLYSYNRNNPSKKFRSNSKYNKQAKYLFDEMSDIHMMPTRGRYRTNCDYLHLFFDDTESNNGQGHLIKIEWFHHEGRDKIYTINNFGYKRDLGRLKFRIKMTSDKVYYTKDGKIKPKLTALKIR